MFNKKNCYCPACKSLLNLQAGFSPKNEKHMCTECGRIVNVVTGEFPADEDAEELYFGDFSVKEGKYGESDNEKTAPLPKIPPQEDGGAPPPEFAGYDGEYPEDDEPAPPPPPPAPEPPPEEENDDDGDSLSGVMSSVQNWKATHAKPLMIAKLVLAVIVLILIIAFLLSNLVAMGYSTNELVGMDKRTVSEMLERQGFVRIKTVPLDDLEYERIDEENMVRSFEIGDVTDFEATKHFLKWKKITIYYSSLQKAALPVSSKDLKDTYYADVEKMFRGAGFVNVKLEEDADLTTGWIHSDGEVEDVFVNNKSKFSANDLHRLDTEIIIVYHTYKK